MVGLTLPHNRHIILAEILLLLSSAFDLRLLIFLGAHSPCESSSARRTIRCACACLPQGMTRRVGNRHGLGSSSGAVLQGFNAPAMIKAFPLADHGKAADVKDGRRLTVRQHVRPHVLQDREFEGCAVMRVLLLQAGDAVKSVESDPFAHYRETDVVVMTDCLVAGRTS